jgi:hypothetical protein
VKTYIVLPSTIFGIACTEFTEKGLQNPVSKQIPALITTSLDRGNTPIIGTGANVWPLVEIGESENPSFYFIFAGQQKKKQRQTFTTSCSTQFSPAKILIVAAKAIISSKTASTPKHRQWRPSPPLYISWAKSRRISLCLSQKRR